MFEELSIDFITGLLLSKLHANVYNTILVIVDRYSKISLYIPAIKTWTAKNFADTFFNLVVCKYGIL